MPFSFKIIAKKAKASQMLRIITHRIADSFYNRIQGGRKNISHSLLIGNSFFTVVYLYQLGYGVPTVIYHRAAEVLLHLFDDEVNAMSVEVAFP